MFIRIVPCLLLAELLLCPSGSAQQAPYPVLTDTQVEVTNFNPEPAHGLALDSNGRLWALNPYASTVVMYSQVTGQPDLIIETGHDPISLAIWESAPGETKLLVACVGTQGLFLYDDSGRLEAYLQLDSEPSDLVVDPDNECALVTCAGSNTVVQVDLNTFVREHTYEISVGERPASLFFDPGPTGAASDNRVFVAASVTSNQSFFVEDDPVTQVGKVEDLDTFGFDTLPDHDVYVIDPGQEAMTVAVTNVGSLLFQVARNPVSNDLWILTSSSNNKDPLRDTEPLINGDVVENQLQIVSTTTFPAAAGNGIDLDDHDPFTAGPQYDPARSVNQARTVDFVEKFVPGGAFVASPLRDIVVALNKNGQRLAEFALPSKAQCYTLLASKQPTPAEPMFNDNHFFALCLGSMTIEVFRWALPMTPTPVASLPLGSDPTLPRVRAGRDVFLDGSLSANARASCAACHPGGRSDQLGWSIGNEPLDFKDVMVTQSLRSIVDTFPHHWRGERDLADFSKAFGGLLGGPTVLEGDPIMQDLIVFFHSLQAPANPNQNPRRIIDDAYTDDVQTLFTDPGRPPAPLVGSAVDGLSAYQSVNGFLGFSCADCHPLETGSGPFINEVFGEIARVASIEAAHLRELSNKGRAVSLCLDSGCDTPGQPVDPLSLTRVNVNGFGFGHNGEFADLTSFISNPVFELSDQQIADVTSFVRQFDQGISPAVHWAAYYDMANATAALEQQIEEILIDGAANGWNDVIFMGRVRYPNNTPMREMRWFYDTDLGKFAPEQGFPAGPAKVDWPTFKFLVQQGRIEGVIAGAPLANGRRLGIDFDGDGILNQDDPDPYDPAPPGADTEPPEVVEIAVDHSSTRMTKMQVEFSEPTRYFVTYGPIGGETLTFERKDFVTQDTFVLPHSDPSPASWDTFEAFAQSIPSGSIRDFVVSQFLAYLGCDDPGELSGLPLPDDPLRVFSASIQMWDRANNSGMLPMALEPVFSPDRMNAEVADGSHQGIFPLHVDSLDWVGSPGRVLNTGTGLWEVSGRFRVAIGTQGPACVDLDQHLVFARVAYKDVATGRFEVADLITTGDTGFDTEALQAVNPDPSPYEALEGPFVLGLTGVTAPAGSTIGPQEADIEFTAVLPEDTEIRLTIFGIVKAKGSVNLDDGTPDVFVFEDLNRFRLLRLEDSAELVD